MPCRERGMALVTVLLLLALLMVMALVLGERVVRTRRDSACNGAREQAMQAATAAVEWARRPLGENYRASGGWTDYLAASSGGERYPQAPAFTLPVGGLTVELFLRDNPDGDDDHHRDNDLKLYVLARARTRLGPEAFVESLCELDGDAGGYAQAGGSAGRDGRVAADGPADLVSATVVGFGLTE